MPELISLVVYVPTSHADVVRTALVTSGAGTIGQYDSCSFSISGTGRFRPLAGASPAIGKTGMLETVEEERIEVVVDNRKDPGTLSRVLKAVVAAHPYEEPAIQVTPLLDYRDFL